MNVFDTELFIAEVEREECIWNCHCNDYTDKNSKLNAWLNICSSMYDCWETFTRDEQELKSEWIIVRINYCD